MATAERVLLEPAVQHIGVHSMGAGYRSNGCLRHLAGGDQFGLELACAEVRCVRRVAWLEDSESLSMVSTICCVHTILRNNRRPFKTGLPRAYIQIASLSLFLCLHKSKSPPAQI